MNNSPKNKTSAFIKGVAKRIAEFAGESGEYREPIVVVHGEQNPETILTFQSCVVDTLDVSNSIRNIGSMGQLMNYLHRGTHHAPVFYREAGLTPTRDTQKQIVTLFQDERKRHFMPLLLIALHEHPDVYEMVRTKPRPLLPAFVKLVGSRIVDISPAAVTGTVPFPVRMERFFRVMVVRISNIDIDQEAADLLRDAIANNATTSDDMVRRLAAAACTRAKELKRETITREILWEVFPERFREAVMPNGATVQ